MIRHTIQEEVGVNSTGAESTDLKVNVFPKNELVCLQNVCVTNQNKNNSVIDVGVIIGGAIQWITSIKVTSQGQYYSWTGEVFFKSCKTIILRFNNTDDGDNLEGYVYGYYLE